MTVADPARRRHLDAVPQASPPEETAPGADWAEVREVLDRLRRLPPEVREHVLDLAVNLHARAEVLDPPADRADLDAWLARDTEAAVAAALDPRSDPEDRRQAVVHLGELAEMGADQFQRAARLYEREQTLERREARLDARAAALDQLEGVEPVWALPAAPVAAQLRNLIIDTGDDVATVARGVGVEPEWARAVLSGAMDEVDIPHVQQLCEGLHCTPYDLFGADAARSIAHAYGPELWPRYVEPLEPSVDVEPPEIDLDLDP